VKTWLGPLVALVLALTSVAWTYGQNTQRLDTLEERAKEDRRENKQNIREIKTDVKEVKQDVQAILRKLDAMEAARDAREKGRR